MQLVLKSQPVSRAAAEVGDGGQDEAYYTDLLQLKLSKAM